jgi:ABC-type sugar transport system permease subunit
MTRSSASPLSPPASPGETAASAGLVRVDADPADQPAPRRRRSGLTGLLFVAPFMLYLTVFLIYPAASGLVTSLRDWQTGTAGGFVGLGNFSEVLDDEIFQSAVRNTLFYIANSLFVIVPLALLLALGVNARWMRGSEFMRVALFVPAVVAPVVIAIIFGIVFAQQGLFSAVLYGLLGMEARPWLNDPTWARFAVATAITWRWTGFIMIYFLAGLKGIPQELYEAARVDRAGPVRQFWHITLPSLRPVTLFVLVIVISGTSQIFEEPRLLSYGTYGPGNSLISVAQYVFDQAFNKANYGLAAAAAIVVLVGVVTVSLVLLRVFRHEDEEASA